MMGCVTGVVMIDQDEDIAMCMQIVMMDEDEDIAVCTNGYTFTNNSIATNKNTFPSCTVLLLY